MSNIKFEQVSVTTVSFALNNPSGKCTIFFSNNGDNQTKWEVVIMDDVIDKPMGAGNVFVVSAHQIDLTLAKLVFEDYLRGNLKNVGPLKKV